MTKPNEPSPSDLGTPKDVKTVKKTNWWELLKTQWKRFGDWSPYHALGHQAHTVKVMIQMLVGLILTCSLFSYVIEIARSPSTYATLASVSAGATTPSPTTISAESATPVPTATGTYAATPTPTPAPANTITSSIWTHVDSAVLLDMIGDALLITTGIELAYMLFTDGPDEAVAPLVTAIAAVILLRIPTGPDSKQDFGPGRALEVSMYVLILALVLQLRSHYLDKEEKRKAAKLERTQKEAELKSVTEQRAGVNAVSTSIGAPPSTQKNQEPPPSRD